MKATKARRNLFDEVMEGFAALKDARLKKRTLRTHVVRLMPVPRLTPTQILEIRTSRNLSRGVFARYLRTNVRTLENWEQGRARPNAQAALLMSLVKNYPDTVDRLATI